MIQWLLRRRIDAFERRWDYDCSHLRTIAEASPRAVLKLSRLEPAMTHREDLPVEVWAAAQVTATMAADCGSCLDLARKVARSVGLSEENIQYILLGKADLMDDDIRIGFSFAQAVTQRDEEEVAKLRGEVVRRWGPRALVSLAMVTATAGFFPALKTAIGRGR